MRRLIAAALVATLVAACTSIDCPVDNIVATSYCLLKADGTKDTLTNDTLTIITKRRNGSDSILLNQSVSTTAFSLPISSGVPVDTLLLELRDSTGSTYDYLYVAKNDVPHFESVDCSMSYFHTITSVAWTGNRIDSVAINKPTVDYDSSTPHILIYFNNPR